MAVAIALAGAGSAAASPFEVDSTDTADNIEIKCAFELRESSGAETRIAPKFALAMPLSDHLEFEAGTMRREVIRDGASRSGLGDTTLEFKWRFASETHHRPALAVIPELSLPTGSEGRGLGSGHTEVSIPLAAEKSFGAYKLSGKLGYTRSFGGDKESLPFGALVTLKPVKALKVGLELAGDAPTRDLSAFKLNANFGFKWKLTPRAELHGLVGRTVRSAGTRPVTRFKLVVEMRM